MQKRAGTFCQKDSFMHLRFTLALAAPLLAVLCTPASGKTDALDKMRTSGEIVLGYRPDAIPFSYTLAGATAPVGYAIDICKNLVLAIQRDAQIPNLRIKYLPVDNKQRFPAVAEGRVDLECGDTTNTRERREKLGMAFSVPYYIAGTRMLVRTDSNITRIEDMGNKTILTTKGTTSVKIVKEKETALMIKIKLLECDETPQCFDMVAQRKADAWLMDDIMLYSSRAASPKPQEFAVVGKFMSIEPLTVMMHKDDIGLKKIVDTEMKKMVYSQQLAGLYTKWFESPIAPQGVNLRIPMSYLLRDSLKFPSDDIGDH